MYEYQAELVRVIDGDTIVLRVDLGFSIYSEHSVRLTGINCPERGTPEGTAATEFTTQWLAENGPAFVVRTHKGGETEKYGRYLGTIIPIPYVQGESLNRALLMASHAVPMKG